MGLISIAPEIVEIFAPSDYYSAIWVIPPLVISVYFMFMYSLFACFEYYYEKSNFLMIASTIGGILNIVLNYFFIKEFGFIAAGYTTLFCYAFYAIVHYAFMRIIQKRNLSNIKVYNPIVIIAISVVFMISTAIMMATYNLIVIRYCIIVFALMVIIFKRKQIMNSIKEVRRNN